MSTIGPQMQGTLEPTGLQMTGPAMQEGDAGFGLLLGGMLSQTPGGSSCTPAPPGGVSGLPGGRFASLVLPPVGENPVMTPPESGDDPADIVALVLRALRETLGGVAGLSLETGETVSDDAAPNDSEERDATAVVTTPTLGQGGTLSAVSSLGVSASDIGGVPGGECKAAGDGDVDSVVLLAAEGRKSAKPILSSLNGGGTPDQQQEASAGFADGADDDPAKGAESGIVVRDHLSGRKAVVGDAAEVFPDKPSGNSGTGSSPADLSSGRYESSSVGSAASSDSTETNANGSDTSGRNHESPSRADRMGRVNDAMSVPFEMKVESSTTASPKHVSEPVKSFEVPGERFVVLRQDETSVQISVKIENLGKVRIDLMMDDGVVNAQIQASDGAAKSIIENNLGQLLQNLEREGVSIGNVEVSLRDRRGLSEEDAGSRTRRDAADAAAVEAKTLSGAQGLISIYA